MLKVGMFWAFIFTSISVFSQSFNQPSIWLRGDSLISNANSWSNSGDNGFNATFSGKISKESINYNSSLVLDGSSYLEIPYNVDSLSDLTIFSVYLRNSIGAKNDTSEYLVWSSEKTLDRNIFLTTGKSLGPDSTYDSYQINRGIPTSSLVFQRWEKAQDLSEEASLRIGSSETLKEYDGLQGLFSEFIVFDRALSFLEKVQIETYLAIKYGINKTSGNYVSSEGKLLWDLKNNKEFSNDVIGIGRDDTYGLYQKQAMGTSDTSNFVILTSGELATSNEENSSVIPDQNFILIGNNRGAFELELTDKQTGLEVLQRKWLVTATGNQASGLQSILQLDFNALPPDSLGYWLVVNRSGRDFTSDHLEYFEADSINADGIAFFNLTWDIDHSGSDAFSIARQESLFASVLDIQKPLCTNPSTGVASFKIVKGSSPFRYRVMKDNGYYDSSFDGEEYVTQEGLSAGDYHLYITDAKGLEFSRAFSIEVQDAIPIDLGEEVSLIGQNEVRLDANDYLSDTLDVQISWESNFGFESKEPIITVTESGIYTLSVTNNDGCVFSDSKIVSGAPFQKVAVYPSVSNDGYYSVNISLDEVDQVQIEVIDLFGHSEAKMSGKDQSEYRFEGYLNGSGMHIIHIQMPEGHITRKVIKQ